MVISYRIYEKDDEVLLAACDKELLGETLEEGEIHFEVKESFYGGNIADENELCKYFNDITVANLVGTKAVNTAIEEGFGFE